MNNTQEAVDKHLEQQLRDLAQQFSKRAHSRDTGNADSQAFRTMKQILQDELGN